MQARIFISSISSYALLLFEVVSIDSHLFRKIIFSTAVSYLKMPPLKAAIILLALSITSVLSNPITPTSRSTTNSGKRGLAYSNPPTLIKYFNKHGSKVTWAYDWDSHLDPNFPSYLEFVPMLWGNDSGHTAVWNKNVNAAIKKGTNNILTFNEPDMCGGGQSCITPQAAVASWRTFVEPFAGKVKLGAPAVTEVGTPVCSFFEFV